MPLIPIQATGINVDIPAAEVPMDEFTGGQNVQFRNGSAVRSDGWGRIFPTPNFPPQHLINASYQGVNYWINCGETGIEITDSTTWTDITPPGFIAATEPNQYTSGILNGIVVLNLGNFLNVPWYLDWSTTALLPLPGWPALTFCGALRTHKFHIIAMEILADSVLYADQVLWSSAADAGQVPGTWAPAPDNDAGSTTLSATRSPIIDGHSLRGNFYIYKAAAVYVMSYIGGTFVFSFKKLFASTGMLARNCGLEFEGRAYVLSDSALISHDGQTITDIGTRKVQDFLFQQIDPTAWQYSFIALDKPHNEVLFCVAWVNDPVPSVAGVYSTNGGGWGVRDLGTCGHIASGIVDVLDYSPAWDDQPPTNLWDDSNMVWNQSRFNSANDGLLMADPIQALVYELDGASSQDGAPISFRVTKQEMDLGEAGRFKFVNKVWPHVTTEASTVMQVRVGSAPSQDAEVSWSPAVDYNPSTEAWVDTFANGRYISIEVTAEGGQRFQLDRIDLETELAGVY
jgi:hypothetical protein